MAAARYVTGSMFQPAKVACFGMFGLEMVPQMTLRRGLVRVLEDSLIFPMILNGSMIEFCNPSVQYGRGVSCGFQLPQRNPDAGAAVTILRGCQSRRRRAGFDRVHDPALDRKVVWKPIALDQPLNDLWPAASNDPEPRSSRTGCLG